MSGQEEAPTPKPVSALMQRLKSNAVAIQSRKQTGVDTPEAGVAAAAAASPTAATRSPQAGNVQLTSNPVFRAIPEPPLYTASSTLKASGSTPADDGRDPVAIAVNPTTALAVTHGLRQIKVLYKPDPKVPEKFVTKVQGLTWAGDQGPVRFHFIFLSSTDSAFDTMMTDSGVFCTAHSLTVGGCQRHSDFAIPRLAQQRGQKSAGDGI